MKISCFVLSIHFLLHSFPRPSADVLDEQFWKQWARRPVTHTQEIEEKLEAKRISQGSLESQSIWNESLSYMCTTYIRIYIHTKYLYVCVGGVYIKREKLDSLE